MGRHLNLRAEQVQRSPPLRTWSPEEDELLRSMRVSGALVVEVASKLNRSRREISARYSQLGMGLSIAERCERARACFEAYSGRWSACEDENLVRLRLAGLSNPEIATQLCRTVPAVQTRISALRKYEVLDAEHEATARAERAKRHQASRDRRRRDVDLKLAASGAAPQKRLPWAVEDDQALLRLVESGADAAQVAIALGRTANSVQKRGHRIGVEVRLPRAQASVVEHSATARTVDASSRGPLRWPAQDDAQLVQMKAAGHTLMELAVMLRRTKQAVIHRLKTLRKQGAPLVSRPGAGQRRQSTS